MGYFTKTLYSALKLIFELDSETYIIVWTSLKVSVSATFLSSLIGIPAGLFISLKRFRGKQFIHLLLNTLMALPTVVVGLFFYALLSRQGLLGNFGFLYSQAGIIIGETFLALPIIANYTVSAVSGADSRLLTTCKSLGATATQQAMLFLKEARFAIVAAVVAGFGRVIAEVGVAMMLGGNIRGFTRTMTTAIALQTSKGEFELGLALGIMLLSTAFAVNIFLFFFQRNKNE